MISLFLVSLLSACPGLESAEPSEKLIVQDLKGTPDGKLFYVSVEIGEDNARQPFNLLVSTWLNGFTWLASDDLNARRGYKNTSTKLYSTGANLMTFARVDHGYDVHSDTWRIGSQNSELPFGVLHRVSTYDWTSMRANLDGILGLKIDSWGPPSEDLILERLKEQNKIDHLRYSLYINKTALKIQKANPDSRRPVGKLILGGHEERYLSSPVTYVRTDESHMKHWPNRHKCDIVYPDASRSLRISVLRLDWARARATSGSSSTPRQMDLQRTSNWLILDSTTIQFAGPKEALDRLHVNILGARRILDGSIYAFDNCRLDNKPNLVFSLGPQFNATIEPADYVIERLIHGRPVCISAFKSSGGSVWIFGTKFLSNYCTIFDPVAGTVGFAQPV